MEAYATIIFREVADIRSEYESQLYQLNSVHKFQEGDRTFDARVVGVTLEGKLLLKEAENTTEYDLQQLIWLA